MFGLFQRVQMTDPRERIEQELAEDEHLLWADRPLSLRPYFFKALPILIFGIPFFAFSLFWSGAVLFATGATSWDDIAFASFGIPFILIGAGLVLSPIWKLQVARSSIYALTDQRVLILRQFPSQMLRSWSIGSIGNITRTSRPNGTGNLFFTEERRTGSKGKSYIEKIGFLGIHDPKRLEDTIRKLTAKRA
ncbi:MAG: hypothetical protein AAGF29_03985 [Pseudomonadota bacterium]